MSLITRPAANVLLSYNNALWIRIAGRTPSLSPPTCRVNCIIISGCYGSIRSIRPCGPKGAIGVTGPQGLPEATPGP